MSAPAMSFLHTDIRRDANPTPTRFLLECGAFTPGLGLNLESSFNPFDTSYKFLNTGTPKAELNPFDTSFRAPSNVSVLSSSSNNNPLKDESLESLDTNHSWPDDMFDAEKMTSNSPGFSPSYSSSSSFSASPSPHLPSPPMNPALLQLSFPPAVFPSETRSNTYPAYENSIQNSVLEPVKTFHKNPTFSHYRSADQVDANAQTTYDLVDHRMSTEGNDFMGSPREHIDQDEEDADYSEEPLVKELHSPKQATATKSPKRTKSHDTPHKVAKSRKRKTEQLSPEAKRQRFLERNRKAASKCREKKRLQTLQIINDADAITAQNQELHENLAELEEEVRRLKNQILGHRDCGCDVIQKFVQSFDDGHPSSSTSSFEHLSSSTSSLSPSRTEFSFSMPSSIF
ncbi:Alcohol O-acetyltransferase [Podila clonocystis]|nr:Alcohol O-acetyltransferase [Podila clonocystis]